ncbi:cytochrome P450 [Mycena belliarum]|uniref:Cytochrome P450 n=1 Tax=Mycena belliarum TaxID=1033014 RepID=A0AAD6XXU0_9AGAR|nr:cytochrome P450 [Mycena belliae]
MDSPIKHAAFFFSTLLTAAIVLAFTFWKRKILQKSANSLSAPRPTSIAYPILGSLQYFSRHWDFLRSATKNGPVSYHLASHKCIAVPVENRQQFFSDSRTSFALAYAVMLGATPSMNKDFLSSMGFDITLGGRSNKFLVALMRKERINDNLPILYSYADQCISGLSAQTNPFETIYATIFRLTVNTIASSSIASSPAICAALGEIFHELDQSGTPFTILFPWFMGWERIQRFYLMKKFYNIMTAAIDERRKEGRNEDDPMQYFIDAGLSSMEITQFTLAALFAGIANTGIVAAYILCDLATHPEYLAQVREELDGFVSSFNQDESIPLSTRIQSITYEDWIATGNLPILDRCLTETLRLRIATPLHRLNDSGKDIEIGGILMPRDTIMTFHTSFMHHNEDFYTEPLKWDPERFSEGREEDKSAPMSFCGWGLGRHQCLGQKFAKFEIFLLTALMVSSYDMQAVNKDGLPITEMPPVELNNTVISPPNPAVHLKLLARS